MKGRKWFIATLLLSALFLGLMAGTIVYVDPYFHYHKPHTDKFYYEMVNQRSINNGVMRHFDYDAIITGTSLTENFSTSELDALFGTKSIKVPTSGASYYEVNNNLQTAIENNPDIKMIVRCLDILMYFDAKDKMRNDLGTYPEHLYDDKLYNDVKYIFNREIFCDIVVPMIQEKIRGGLPGIDSFDIYSNWYELFDFGVGVLYPDKELDLSRKGEPIHISEEEKRIVIENIEENVCAIARENPQIQFYYYLSPYSAAWWQGLNETGEIYKYLEAERLVIEHILSCNNIKLFSANTETEITADLNNYKDSTHYGPWINSLVLVWMSKDQFLLTEDNYETYLADMESMYTQYDYNSLLKQEDYDEDSAVAEKLEQMYACKLGDYTKNGTYKRVYYN